MRRTALAIIAAVTVGAITIVGVSYADTASSSSTTGPRGGVGVPGGGFQGGFPGGPGRPGGFGQNGGGLPGSGQQLPGQLGSGQSGLSQPRPTSGT